MRFSIDLAITNSCTRFHKYYCFVVYIHQLYFCLNSFLSYENIIDNPVFFPRYMIISANGVEKCEFH